MTESLASWRKANDFIVSEEPEKYITKYSTRATTIPTIDIKVFFVYQIAMQPKKTLMSIVGIVVALVLYFVMYFSGSSDTMKSLALRHEASDSVIAATSAGVYTIGICIAVGLLVVVFGPFMGKLRSSRK
jgi:ACR3 family arsenite efflux pump ArsB